MKMVLMSIQNIDFSLIDKKKIMILLEKLLPEKNNDFSLKTFD